MDRQAIKYESDRSALLVKNLKIEKRMTKRADVERRENFIAQLLNAKTPTKEIIDITGESRYRIFKVASAQKTTRRTSGASPDLERYTTILYLISIGETHREISARYGVARATISQIAARAKRSALDKR